jgi:hypothetical protein
VVLPYSLAKAEFTLRDRRLIRIQSASLSYDPGLTILESQPTGSLILEFGFIGQHAVLEGYVEMVRMDGCAICQSCGKEYILSACRRGLTKEQKISFHFMESTSAPGPSEYQIVIIDYGS